MQGTSSFFLGFGCLLRNIFEEDRKGAINIQHVQAHIRTTKKKRTEKITGLTALHCSIFPERIFKPSSTISPAMMALVVAIAGMMFPAMAAEQAEREISLACKKRERENKNWKRSRETICSYI